MQNYLIRQYLASLRRALFWRGIWDAQVIAEIHEHLAEAVEQGLAQGMDAGEAERLAIARFGPVETVAAQFFRERITRMQTILLLAGVVLGGLIAYIDSRPTWDDTGITVAALLLAAGLLGTISPRRPWRWALAVGIWLPLLEIILSRNFTLLVVLIFPFIGAYAGAGFNWAIRRTFRPA